MTQTRTFIPWAVTAIAALCCLVLLLGQILVPIAARDAGQMYPEVQHLVLPYSILGICTLACFQIALIILCVILVRRTQESFFTSATRTWILACGSMCILGFAIPAATAIHLLATLHAGGAGVMIGLLASLLAAGGFACITYLALKAFDVARENHEELGGVI